MSDWVKYRILSWREVQLLKINIEHYLKAYPRCSSTAWKDPNEHQIRRHLRIRCCVCLCIRYFHRQIEFLKRWSGQAKNYWWLCRILSRYLCLSLQYRPERQLVRWPQRLEQSWWVLTYLLQERGNKGDGEGVATRESMIIIIIWTRWLLTLEL